MPALGTVPSRCWTALAVTEEAAHMPHARENKSTLKNIVFGKASAERESAENPDLLTKGFLDPFHLAHEARDGSKFLFLGYKGSGKSAIGEHLKLTADSDSQLFVSHLSLADFPFTPFSKLIEADSEPESKYPSAWSWLLLLQLLTSFSEDQGSNVHCDDELFYAFESLKEAGLIPSPNFNHLVNTSTKTSASMKLAGVGAVFEKAYNGSSIDIPFFVVRLKLLAQRYKSSSRHLLILDGLDDILTQRGPQYESLAALIYEADRLNIMFTRDAIPAKIIILCRTDLFERLPNANKNKIRQDSAVHLDWYHDPRTPERSRLIELVNHRSSISFGYPLDIFKDFLPERVYRPKDLLGQDTRRILLDLTRHTPRDMISLMNHIQKFYTRGRLSHDQLLSGARSYSVDYFVPEIKDELAGYFPPEDIDKTMVLLGALRKRDFTFSELAEQARVTKGSETVNLDLAAKLLFDCSAIGNVDVWPGGTTYYTFKYRNRNSVLNLARRLILHKGMWKALNLT
jgi:hypothetical protein